MYALTIHQPWAWAIMAGIKRVENRTWRTSHRGPLVIHAGKHRPRPRKRDWDRLPDGTRCRQLTTWRSAPCWAWATWSTSCRPTIPL